MLKMPQKVKAKIEKGLQEETILYHEDALMKMGYLKHKKKRRKNQMKQDKGKMKKKAKKEEQENGSEKEEETGIA